MPVSKTSVSKTIRFSGKGQPGDLLDPHNWAEGVIPGVNDTALITMNVGGPVAGIFAVNNMMLLGTETITFTGTLDTAGVGACHGLMVCDGAVAVFAPGSTLNDGNVLIVGNDAVGTLLAKGSGSLHSVINSVDANLGKQDAGVGTVTIDDAVWTNSGHAYIGDNGAATLNVVNNGFVSFGGDVAMAAAAGSTGTMTIAGGGAVDVTGALRLGGAAPDAFGTALVRLGSGGSLAVAQSLSVGTGSEVDLAGGTISGGVTGDCVKVLTGGVIAGHGTLAAPDGVAIQDAGTIRASGGTLTVNGNVVGTGTIELGADSTAALTGSSLKLAAIAFIGADSTLALAHGSHVTAAISGFAIGDAISMAAVDAVSFNAPTGVLTLSEHNAQVESLHLAGSFAGDVFALHQTAAGAVITLQHG